MSIKAGAICLAIACSLWACTTSATDPAPEPAPAPVADPVPVTISDDGQETILQAVIAPTEEMLAAALTEDPDAMRDATTSLNSCQPTSTCPAEYGSCTPWSTATLCEQECGVGICKCTPVWACDVEVKGRESLNSYRVCFNSGGQACTEWNQTTYFTCGC